MTTYDSEETPLDIQKVIEKSPELFILNMENLLRKGNLDALGSFSSELMTMGTENPKAMALHSIFLASTGRITDAKVILKRISDPSKNLYALLAKAMVLRSEKKYNEALQTCDRAIDLDPGGHPFIWNVKGRIYFDHGEYPKAIDSFKKALAIQANFLPANTNLGAVFFTTGDYPAAAQYFKKAKILNPRSVQAIYGFAVTQEKLGQPDFAIKELETALDLNPDHGASQNELARLYISQRKYQDALNLGMEMEKSGSPGAYEILGSAALYMEEFEKAKAYLTSAPKNTLSIKYLMGFYFMLQNDYEKALKTMEEISDENPSHYGSYYAAASLKLYLGKGRSADTNSNTSWGEQLDKGIFFAKGMESVLVGDYNTAYEDLKACKDMIQGFSIEGIDSETLMKGLTAGEVPYLNMGIFYYLNNYYSAALKEFEKSIETHPSSILSNYWAGQTYLSLGDRQKAHLLFNTAIENAPNFFAALYASAELYVIAGKFDRAIIEYEKASTVKKDVGVLVKLGLLHERDKKYEKAAFFYRELIDHHPDFYIGYNQLAWLYAQQSIKLGEALEFAKEADRLQPGNASIHDTIGWIYFLKKDYKTALEKLNEANQFGPNNPTILYHLGVANHAVKDRVMAKKYLETALKLSKGFSEKAKAEALLKELDE